MLLPLVQISTSSDILAQYANLIPDQIGFGMMNTSAFISAWICNIAIAVIIGPIDNSIMKFLKLMKELRIS